MLLIKLIRYCKGYIVFTAKGEFIERFLNLSAKNRISIWDCKKVGDSLEGTTTISSFNDLLELAQRVGVQISIEKKTGILCRAKRYEARKGMLCGIAVFILILFISSRYIWEIEIDGADNINKDVIMDNLEMFGLSQGAKKSDIDAKILEDQMKIAIDDISWIGVNITGSKATIKIKERTVAPEMIDTGKPSNIVAKNSGIITYIEIYDGKPMVKVGDSVAKGDMLVSGIINDAVNNSYVKQARALVIASASKTKQFSFPLKQEMYVPTNKVVNKKRMRILNFEFDINKNKVPEGEYTHRTIKDNLSFFGIKMPAYIITQQYMPLKKETITVSVEKAKEMTKVDMQKFEESFLKDKTVTEKNITGEVKNNSFVMDCQYIFEENIAFSQEILKNIDTFVE